MSIISRIIILIFALILPIIAVYTYSNRETIGVMTDQIDNFNKTRMEYFMDELDQSVQNLSFYAYSLMSDPDISFFSSRYLEKFGYDRYEIRTAVESKMSIVNNSNSPWDYWIALHFPGAKTLVSNKSTRDYSDQYLTSHSTKQWVYEYAKEPASPPGYFLTRLFTLAKPKNDDILKAPVVVQVSIPASNVVRKLDSFKTSGINDPFYFHSTKEVIFNSSAHQELIRQIIPEIEGWQGKKVSRIIEVGGKKYAVYAERSSQMGWTLVDYVPLGDVFAPIYRSNILFYSIVIVLILMGLIASIALYTQIQVPIRTLIKNVRRLRQGEFSTRIRSSHRYEFKQLFDSFNDMASEIQELVEKVYLEEIRSKEAVMKQLQSQINPHFLYNCFAYLISMSKMKRNEAINAMAYRLASYYKYATKNDNMVTTVKDEIEFVTKYLEIMDMQLEKINYDVYVDPAMECIRIPRLLLQPLVENAVVHGMETKAEQGKILIRCEQTGEDNRIVVEDDGHGMTGPELDALNQIIQWQEEPESHIGLWNVQQRLKYIFGPASKLTLAASSYGGVRAEICWSKKECI